MISNIRVWLELEWKRVLCPAQKTSRWIDGAEIHRWPVRVGNVALIVASVSVSDIAPLPIYLKSLFDRGMVSVETTDSRLWPVPSHHRKKRGNKSGHHIPTLLIGGDDVDGGLGASSAFTETLFRADTPSPHVFYLTSSRITQHSQVSSML